MSNMYVNIREKFYMLKREREIEGVASLYICLAVGINIYMLII